MLYNCAVASLGCYHVIMQKYIFMEICRINHMWMNFSLRRESMTFLCVNSQRKIQCIPLN